MANFVLTQDTQDRKVSPYLLKYLRILHKASFVDRNNKPVSQDDLNHLVHGLNRTQPFHTNEHHKYSIFLHQLLLAAGSDMALLFHRALGYQVFGILLEEERRQILSQMTLQKEIFIGDIGLEHAAQIIFILPEGTESEDGHRAPVWTSERRIPAIAVLMSVSSPDLNVSMLSSDLASRNNGLMLELT